MITKDDMTRVFGAYVEPDGETLFVEMCDDFCCQVILEMERQGLTVAALARRMGVSRPTLSEQLSGDRNLTLKTMGNIARALGCALEAPRLVPAGE
jgi:DNA-binding phage protein